jgi:hypothetical protein
MLEWLKRHAWKACKRLKRFTGSNPVLSANKCRNRYKSVAVYFLSLSVWLPRCKNAPTAIPQFTVGFLSPLFLRVMGETPKCFFT